MASRIVGSSIHTGSYIQSSTDTSGGITHDEAKRAVDELVTLLECNFSFDDGSRINEIIKAGSLGHGTAVFGDFDVDLVIYSDGVNITKRSDFQHYLIQLDAFLRRKLGSYYVQTEKERQALTKWRSVQFTYKGKVAVDLLVSPNWSDYHQFYSFLKSIDDPSDFTVFASKWQVQFFKKQLPQVKEYIRRAKAWRNKIWSLERGGEGKPSSYLMSLLVLRAYETGGSSPSSITERLKTIVKGSPDIYWEEYYHLNRCQETHSQVLEYKPLYLPSHPRILDPANPLNNVWVSGFRTFKPHERIYDYKPGDGNARPLRMNINSIDLSQEDGLDKRYF